MKIMKVQLSIQKLKNIIEIAESNKRYDSSLSDTIQIELIKESDLHLHNDDVRIYQKNNYSECTSKFLGM